MNAETHVENLQVILSSTKYNQATKRNLGNVLKSLTWVSWRMVKWTQYLYFPLLPEINILRLRQSPDDFHSVSPITCSSFPILHSLDQVIWLPGMCTMLGTLIHLNSRCLLFFSKTFRGLFFSILLLLTNYFHGEMRRNLNFFCLHLRWCMSNCSVQRVTWRAC